VLLPPLLLLCVGDSRRIAQTTIDTQFIANVEADLAALIRSAGVSVVNAAVTCLCRLSQVRARAHAWCGVSVCVMRRLCRTIEN
jgi:hypothetical protein